MGNNTCVHSFNSVNNSSNRETGLRYFFRPKLRIEFHEDKEKSTFTPERTFGETRNAIFIRKYKRIRVRNNGRGLARNCKARLEITIPKGADPNRYPSDDSRNLYWEGSGIQQDTSTIKNIQPMEGRELLHVVFSDSRFLNTSMIPQQKFASISTNESLNHLGIVVEDGFAEGDFIVVVTVVSDETATRAKFKVHVERDYRGLSMNKLSKFENLKLRLRLYR
jgi:hypothetical protein